MTVRKSSVSAALATLLVAVPLGTVLVTQANGATSAAKVTAASATRVESVYRNGLQAGWQDYGWAPRQVTGKGPAKLDMGNYGGWIIAKPKLLGYFSAVQFRAKSPVGLSGFLKISVGADGVEGLPEVASPAGDDIGDGWKRVTIPLAQLSPKGVAFDRVVFRAGKGLPVGTEVLLDDINLVASTKELGVPGVGETQRPLTRAAGAKTPPAQPATMRIDCTAERKGISPLIYGVAFNAGKEAQGDTSVYALGTTARRWGGNPTSRYNPDVVAWNTSLDYFWLNTDVPDHKTFLRNNAAHGVTSALTIPMLGWVAKDRTSYAFPVSAYGSQQNVEPFTPDAGNGVDPKGKPITGDPAQTSVPFPPAAAGRMVAAVKGQVGMYFLDNEPELWHLQHRDVSPVPLTYDELLSRTVAYASAIRKADPDATIAGPTSWGYTGYLYSAADQVAGFDARPDRRAHGDTPLIPWYLAKLREHEQKTGEKLLDVLDVHFYPQITGVYDANTEPQIDEKTAKLRIRSTRSLWDPKYKEESWIPEPVALIPRLRKWIDENYPGLGISIGEYNFGGEGHMSGGLAQAEALGQFGRGGVTAAFNWIFPPPDSPAGMAFRAFRNYDGKGGRFLDTSVRATVNATGKANASEGLSMFASTDGTQTVAVILNFSFTTPAAATISVTGCGPRTLATSAAYVYEGTGKAFTPIGSTRNAKANTVDVTLRPYSITVLRLG